jgi:hypothetical protein
MEHHLDPVLVEQLEECLGRADLTVPEFGIRLGPATIMILDLYILDRYI